MDIPDYNDEQFIYVTTTGWKSGQPHQIEIWFAQYHELFYIVAEMGERAHWVQNIRRNPQVRFRLRSDVYTGEGRVVEADAEPELAAEVRALMEAKYDWGDGLIVELAALPED